LGVGKFRRQRDGMTETHRVDFRRGLLDAVKENPAEEKPIRIQELG
jgi:hypothetical protein